MYIFGMNLPLAELFFIVIIFGFIIIPILMYRLICKFLDSKYKKENEVLKKELELLRKNKK
ncbi:MAG: hypothetical protein NDI94_02920 [Candidatus Woesearchaeota archaeon]|nr:hypothetical protein [Candidatus Woesearchaeota archaeon]